MDQKKIDHLPKLNATLRPPPPNQRQLELDELWSFVQNKKNHCWVWIALCAITKQVVAVIAGDRSAKTCRALWRNIPCRYRRAKCYSDFWEAYQTVIPSEQHEAVEGYVTNSIVATLWQQSFLQDKFHKNEWLETKMIY